MKIVVICWLHNIKEEHCKMYLDKTISEYTLKLIKFCYYKKKF